MDKIILAILISATVTFCQPASTDVVGYDGLELKIPERLENALQGSEFLKRISGLSISEREKAVVKEVLSGNVPSFSRIIVPVKISETVDNTSYELVFFTTCDYLAIGSDQDYVYMPMTPATAQYLADKMNSLLPTKKMVDIIYTNAGIKLKPQPIPPSDAMTTVPVFMQHTDSIKQQVMQMASGRSVEQIVAGHKKDIIISNKIYNPDGAADRVVIYGWHSGEGNPIQPVYNGHVDWYADYSHGVRFISKSVFINQDSIQVDDILKDSDLSTLLSHEGVINKPYYPSSDILPPQGNKF